MVASYPRVPRFVVLVFALAAAGLATTGIFTGFTGWIAEQLRWPLSLTVVLPYATVLALLYARAPARAYALAMGTAIVALLSVGLFAGVLTLFAPLTFGNRAQLRFIIFLDAFVVTQLPLLAAAIAGWRGTRRDARPVSALPIGFAAPLALALAVAFGLQAFQHYHQRRRDNALANEAALGEALRSLDACLHDDAARNGGFPSTLTAAARHDPRCRAQTTGYHLAYLPGLPSHGRIGVYQLCATPQAFKHSGWSTAVGDEAGLGSQVAPQDDANRPFTCSEAWGSEPVRMVKQCLVEYASRNKHYPETLELVGPQGTRCIDPGPAGRLQFDGDVLATPFSMVRYAGWATGYELRGEGTAGQWQVNLMLDETGAVHAARDREARRDDPPADELARQLDEREAVRLRERELLGRRCDAQEAAACLELAAREADRGRPDAADSAWARACALGSPTGCLLSVRASDPPLFTTASSLDFDCRAERAKACKLLAALARDHAACQTGDPAGCFGVAVRLGRQGHTEAANVLWERGCRQGHAASCYFWKVRDAHYAGALALQEKCDAGERAACRDLARRVAGPLPETHPFGP